MNRDELLYLQDAADTSFISRGKTAPLLGRRPAGDKARESAPSLRFGVILMPDFTLSALSNFVDALRIAADVADKSRQRLIGWDVMSPLATSVTSSCGLTVQTTRLAVEPAGMNYLVVVGGLLQGNAKNPPALDKYLQAAAQAHVPLVGLCTGSFVLARAGLMEGRQCSVHYCHTEEFHKEFPNVKVSSDSLYSLDYDRITCVGGSSSSDLAIHLIDKHFGSVRSTKVRRTMGLDVARSPQHPQPHFATSVQDRHVRQAMILMEHNLTRRISLSEIAAEIGTSLRNLERKFVSAHGVSPTTYFRNLRIRHAQWMLDHTQKQIGQIADDCGFVDAAHFCRCFKAVFGTTPSTYRSRMNS